MNRKQRRAAERNLRIVERQVMGLPIHEFATHEERAQALFKETGWSHYRCLKIVKAKSPTAVAIMVREWKRLRAPRPRMSLATRRYFEGVQR